MERIVQPVSIDEYLNGMRRRLDNRLTSFEEERINGIVIGGLFSIAHHCKWEWDRNQSAETSRAMGIVREREG